MSSTALAKGGRGSLRRLRRAAVAGVAVSAMLALMSGTALADNGSSSPTPGTSGGTGAAGGKTFYIGVTGDVDSLNPYSGFLSISYEVYGDVYDLLQGWSQKDYSWTPGLAESYTTSPDGLTWTFKIRSGVSWSDGQPFSAKDVAYTFNRAINDDTANAAYNNYVKNIKSVEAPDDTTAIFHMNAADPIMTQLWVPILPEHIWSKVSKADTGSFKNEEMIGTGAFQMDKYVAGQYIRLKANKSYWGGAPKIDFIEYKIYTDEDAMIQALRKGDIDAVDGITAASYNSLSGAAGISRIDARPGSSFDELGFNTGAALTDGTKVGNGAPAARDPKFRDAIGYAIDLKSLTNKVLQGYGTIGQSIIPPGYTKYAWDPGSARRSYDPNKAGQLLDAAGYTKGSDGFRIDPATHKEMNLRLISNTDSAFYKQDLAYISAYLSAVGIKNNTQLVESDKETDLIANGEYDLFIWGWGVEPDPSFQLSTMTCDQRDTGDAKSPTAGWSDSFYCNPAYDQMFTQQGQTVDLTQRATIVKNMQQLLYQDSPYIVLYYSDDLEAYNSAKWGDIQIQGGKNGNAFFQYGTFTYRSIDLASDIKASGGAGAAGSSGGGGGIPTVVWIIIIVVVVLALGGAGAAMVMRRGSADERE